MKNATKRLLSLVIVLAMALSLLPVLTFAADATTTVYCQAPDNWTKCKAYWWGSKTGTNPSWSGVDMTKDENGIWFYDVPSDATGLIFNNGSGTQTKDLTVPTDGNVMYVFANSYWTTYGPVEVVAEYFVAGSAGLCGVEWDPGAAASKMADPDGDGVFAKTFSGVAAGEYEFKITNGSWAESWGLNGGEKNIPLSLTAAKSTVDIRFDSNTKLVKIIVNGSPVQLPTEPETEPTEPVAEGFYVAGDFNDWNCADAAYIMNDNGDGTYTLTFAVTVGEQGLKVTNGTWEQSWGADTASGNYEINVIADGEITVTFDGTTVTVTGDCLGEVEKQPLEINTVHVVGAPGLTGADWDTAANEMALVDDVYTITFENVAAGTYEYKFAANGTWDINWAAGVEVESGVEYDAWINAMGNNSLTVPADGATVTLTLDLTTMDPITGNGGKCTATISGVELPEPPETVYYVAGDFNGWTCDAEGYQMVANEDGTYSLTIAVTVGEQGLKVTNGTWEQSWGADTASGNYEINVIADGEITVTFDGTTVTVTGDCLGEIVPDPLPAIEFVVVAGSPELTGADWDTAANEMALVDGIYTITFENVPAGTYEYKFVANGTWDMNWAAGVEVEPGVEMEAWFQAMGNNSLTVAVDGSTVTLTLNLTNMDPITGNGGTCVAEIVEPATGVYVSGNLTSGADTDATLELIADGTVIATATVSGKTGSYGFGDVVPGTYTLKISKANHVTREYTVVVEGEDVAQDVKICLIGDVSGDGRVNVGDVVRLYSYIRGTATIEDEYLLKCANVNGGSLNIGDAVGLYGHCRGTKKLY